VDVQAVLKALNVLMNLSANDDLATRIAAVPGCVNMLVGLLSHAHQPLAVYAARCLINITHSSPDAQAAALNAGILPPVVAMLLGSSPSPPPASDDSYAANAKLACWLLANLTSSHGSRTREEVLAQPRVVARVVHLATPGSAQAPVVVMACAVLANVARHSPRAQSALADAGALAALADHLGAPGRTQPSSLVLASVLQALSALVMDHAANTAALVARKGLAAQLGALLEARTSPFECDSDDSALVLAAHCLVHVLGHMLCNGGEGSSGKSATAAAAGGAGRPAAGGPDVVDGRASVMVREEQQAHGGGAEASSSGQGQAVYISLSAAARAVGVELPAVLPMLRKDSSEALSPIQAAELRHQVSHVLLPKLRSPNFRAAATAAACIYHLCAACGGPAAREARRLMADGALVAQLLTNCGSGDPALALACLAVLDVLSAEPMCVSVMMSSGWLQAMMPLLGHDDALVRRWSERALCSLYIASGSGKSPTSPSVSVMEH